MPRLLAMLGLVLSALSGCSDGPGDVRYAGQLDRPLTAAEDAEAGRVFGRAPEITATDVFCGPEVDPYGCNEHWLSVDGLTMSHCQRALGILGDRHYWRGVPTCGRLASA